MNSRRGINAALIGLLILVAATWLVRSELFDQHGAPPQHTGGPAVTHTQP